MNVTIWKAYKTETGAKNYANKIFQKSGLIVGIEFIGGLYLVTTS